jgi:hypothetical protein
MPSEWRAATEICVFSGVVTSGVVTAIYLGLFEWKELWEDQEARDLRIELER